MTARLSVCLCAWGTRSAGRENTVCDGGHDSQVGNSSVWDDCRGPHSPACLDALTSCCLELEKGVPRQSFPPFRCPLTRPEGEGTAQGGSGFGSQWVSECWEHGGTEEGLPRGVLRTGFLLDQTAPFVGECECIYLIHSGEMDAWEGEAPWLNTRACLDTLFAWRSPKFMLVEWVWGLRIPQTGSEKEKTC